MPFFTTHRHTKGSVPEESTACSNIFRSNSGGTTSPQIPLFSAAPFSVSTLAGRWLLDLFDFVRGACFSSLTSDLRLFGDSVESLDEMIWKMYIYFVYLVCRYIHTYTHKYYICTHAYPNTHTHTFTYIRANMIHACIHTCYDVYIHTYIRMHASMYAYTYITYMHNSQFHISVTHGYILKFYLFFSESKCVMISVLTNTRITTFTMHLNMFALEYKIQVMNSNIEQAEKKNNDMCNQTFHNTLD